MWKLIYLYKKDVIPYLKSKKRHEQRDSHMLPDLERGKKRGKGPQRQKDTIEIESDGEPRRSPANLPDQAMESRPTGETERERGRQGGRDSICSWSAIKSC